MPTMSNKINAPIPIPGIHADAPRGGTGVAVGVTLGVFVGGSAVWVDVEVGVDEGVEVDVGVSEGVKVKVGGMALGRGVFLISFSVVGQGITPPAASTQSSCALTLNCGDKNKINRPIPNKIKTAFSFIALPYSG